MFASPLRAFSFYMFLCEFILILSHYVFKRDFVQDVFSDVSAFCCFLLSFPFWLGVVDRLKLAAPV